MNVIAFASRKGGAGKSTLAAHLSVYADKPRSPALLIDTDPQGSLSLWHELRQADTPVLVKCEARELPATLAAAKADGIGWAFIDTPPHNSAAIAEAIRAASMVVIPTRPAVFDLAAVQATIEMARELRKPHAVVINSAPPRRGDVEPTIVAEARQAIEAMGAPVWAGQVTQRAALAHALASGQTAQEFETQGPAAAEMSRLWQGVLKSIKAIGEKTK